MIEPELEQAKQRILAEIAKEDIPDLLLDWLLCYRALLPLLKDEKPTTKEPTQKLAMPKK